MAERIQLQRARGWRMPAGAIKVDRSTIYGNPWGVGKPGTLWVPEGRGWSSKLLHDLHLTALQAVRLFEAWTTRRIAFDWRWVPISLTPAGRIKVADALRARRKTIRAALPALRGRDLACWCPIGSPCHADVLLALANREGTAHG